MTLDKDFGKLIFQSSHRHVGVIFLRLKRESQENITRVLVGVLAHYGDRLKGKFVVASEENVRFRS